MAEKTRRPFPARLIGTLVLALAAATLAGTAQAQAVAPPSHGPMGVSRADADRASRADRFRTRLTPPSDETPGNPVPEPATMALASMGLVALGGAIRKRRSH
jgi:hypothetical protein